jgi:hypothetical protein
MSSIERSPQRAPTYVKYRAVAAVETGPFATEKHGINMSGWDKAHIQVVPASGADPTVEVLWWSEGADQFVKEHVALEKAGIGANTPFEFTVDCLGRVMFVAVTTMASGNADIYVAGYGRRHPE